ncbi:hypothetical protein [Haloglomus litoreum]|uniref:hypothetical protein n=1 Tax=Haloglomus litoreum TaxID=3034026 RepID=UPI0023E76531|nr:hypothetical protein [Haloglomus sp. DT116]
MYVDGWRSGTEYKVLEPLLHRLGLRAQVKRSVAHDEFHELVRQHHEPFVVVLDEVDRLEAQTLLRELIEHSEAVVVAITTDADRWVGTLEPRLQSRVTDLRPLAVDAYDTETLADILSPRAARALAGGVGRAGGGELRWSEVGECWFLEVRAKNTAGGGPTVRDAWMLEPVEANVRRVSRERGRGSGASWVQASKSSVRRWVTAAAGEVAEDASQPERWREVSSHDLRRSWATYHLVERQTTSGR